MTTSSRSSLRALAALLAVCLLAATASGEDAPAPFELGESDRLQTVSTEVVMQIVTSGEGPVIIDARGPVEYDNGHVPGALNVPHKETWGRIEELRKYEEDRGIIYYCVKGGRAKIAGKGLLVEGFRKEAEGRPVER
jgi:rhodanese-related sulfurtransferase